jgi:transposase
MKPYSKKLRQKIIETKLETQESDAKIAVRFGVSRSFVNKLVRQFERTGDFAPLPHSGGASLKLTTKEIEFVIRLIEQDSNLTLKKLQQIVCHTTGKTVSIATIHRLLKK